MWPHQSSLREILRCVCYEKMEGSRASCAASRGASGFLCSPRLANFQERGALALDACHHFPNRPSTAPTSGPQLRVPGRGSPRLPPILGKARPDVLSHGAVPRNDAGPGGPAPLARAAAPGAQQMFPLLPASPGCL